MTNWVLHGIGTRLGSQRKPMRAFWQQTATPYW